MSKTSKTLNKIWKHFRIFMWRSFLLILIAAPSFDASDRSIIFNNALDVMVLQDGSLAISSKGLAIACTNRTASYSDFDTKSQKNFFKIS